MDYIRASTTPLPHRAIIDVEKTVHLDIEPLQSGGFSIMSTGMYKYEKPEMVMVVQQGMYLGHACRIMNDVGQYLVDKNHIPISGARVQLAPWTVVQFRHKMIAGVLSLALEDGSSMAFFR
jgi:hypothetical protein